MDTKDILDRVYKISEAADNIKKLVLEYEKTNNDAKKNLIGCMIEQNQYTIKINNEF